MKQSTMIKVLSAVLLLFSIAADGARIKRVKAGMHYKKHDPVHVVVNKVG